jgi:serine/threonine protein kinase
VTENTVGVGTQAYASPEQMRGSDYDASTDVFSLGLILFELLYPMYTAMERYKEFACIRKGNFPAYWNSHVKTSFPTIHGLLVQMISDSASERPTADAVSDRIDSLLREYSVQSLDKSWGKKGALLLRVEAKEKEGILAHTMQLIKDAAPHSTVLQYGLRGQKSKAIMEFALEVEENEKATAIESIRSQLEGNGMSVRRVSNS